MKTIVIATDGTESARAALEVGLQLAADENAEAIIAHVVSVVDVGPLWAESLDAPPHRTPRPEDEPVLAEALELASERGVTATPELLIGYPPKQLVRLANEVDADIIVVGSRPLGRVKRAVLGSTSRALLSLTRRPVLVVAAAAVREEAAAVG